jgi:hypothetical protein
MQIELKLAQRHISSGPEGIDACIVYNFLHDGIIVEARDGVEDQVEAIVSESMGGDWGQLSQMSRLWRRSEWPIRENHKIRNILRYYIINLRTAPLCQSLILNATYRELEVIVPPILFGAFHTLITHAALCCHSENLTRQRTTCFIHVCGPLSH